jgi:uncharacterized protein
MLAKKIVHYFVVFGLMVQPACAQKKSSTPSTNTNSYAKNNNSLLWEVTGKDLKGPSYLFGTIHLLCKDELVLSKELRGIIDTVDKIYFEINMDNMMSEAFSLMFKMNMKDGKTLKTLLSAEDYALVKKHFEKESSMLPFEAIEKMKPLFVQSILAKGQMECDGMDGMEMKIMEANKKNKEKKKPIEGLETAGYQMSIFDSIPYEDQAKDLVKSIKTTDTTESLGGLIKVYKRQNLDEIAKMMSESDKDAITSKYANLLLYKRNNNWIPVIEKAAKERRNLFAVGAAHLAGKGGVIDLLRKAGYTVRPLKNNMNPPI